MTTLGDIASALALELRGDPALEIVGMAPLERAVSNELSFVSQSKYLPQLSDSQAGAVILHPDWAASWSGACLLSDRPYLHYARATRLFDNRPVPTGTIHPTSLVHESATLGTGVTVGPYAVIEAGASIGSDTLVGAGVHIGAGSSVGEGTRIYPGVVLYHGVTIGDACILHANAVIGADGFGFAPGEARWEKILQLGGVIIGNHVEIGAGTTIDRGALGNTVLEDHVILDNQIHIAHNVRIGERTGIAACTGIAGSTTIGRDCTLAGMVGVSDHLTIGDNVHINGQGRVTRSIAEPGVYASGTPIQPHRDWSKNAVRFEQLAQMAKRVAQLEKKLASLMESTNPD